LILRKASKGLSYWVIEDEKTASIRLSAPCWLRSRSLSFFYEKADFADIICLGQEVVELYLSDATDDWIY
jgi:hypothetical protein